MATAFRVTVVLLLTVALSVQAFATGAQESVTWTVTVRVFTCPPGMTADTLVGEDCAPTTEGFDVAIGSLEGPMTPLTLADASFDGSAYTWTLGTNYPDHATPPPTSGPRWTFGETVVPDGYTDYVAVGDTVAPNPHGGYVFQTTWGAPDAFVTVYNIAPAVQPGEQALPLGVNVVNCTSEPTTQFLIVPTPACSPGVGIWFEATGPDGTVYGDCVTELVPNGLSGGCSISVPYDTTVTVTEDEDTIPPGYAPRENPINLHIPAPPFGGPVELRAFVNLPQPAAQPTAAATETPPVGGTVMPNPVLGRPAHVHLGVCGKLRRQGSYDLTDLTAPTGAAEGSRRATVAEASFTVIDVSLDDLLATAHAINVHTSHDAMNVYIVCGEIGGVRRADGSLAVGLREVNGSGYEGIAYLAPDTSDPSKTDVWIFVAPKLAEEERPTGVPATGTPVASAAAG